MKKIISSLLVALPLLLIGCGGGSDDDGDDGGSVPSYPIVTSTSFSPIKAVDSNNQPSALYWEYSVNGGQDIASSLPIPGNPIPITMSFKPISITIDIDGKSRITSGEGSFSGDVNGSRLTGNISLSDQDNFPVSDTPTYIGGSNVSLDLSFTVENETARIKSTSDIQFADPTLWFLDNKDLDTIGLASHTDSTIATTSTTLNSEPPTVVDQIITNSWQIVGHEATATVNNITYTNIVLVELTTEVENSDPIKITYWVAKGIGMIKGVGFFNALGTKVDIELLETNLEQVK